MSIAERLNMEWPVIPFRGWFKPHSRGCEKLMYQHLLRMCEFHHEATRTQRFTKSTYMIILNFARLRDVVPSWQNCMAELFDHEFHHNLSRLDNGDIERGWVPLQGSAPSPDTIHNAIVSSLFPSGERISGCRPIYYNHFKAGPESCI
jgi:hypothetical protein